MKIISKTESIVVVGSGRLASALTLTFGDRVTAVVSSRDDGGIVRQQAPGVRRVRTFRELGEITFDALWMATADRAILPVAEQLAAERENWQGTVVVHSSGATALAALASFQSRGATIIAIHPNTSLTGAMPIPYGLVWGIAPDTDEARRLAGELIGDLAPRLVGVHDNRRAIYHAAASLASNYSLTLFAGAVDLYEQAGLSAEDAARAVEHFMRTSIDRAATQPLREVLTGPIARGDYQVVEAHLAAIAAVAPDRLGLYLALARATAAMVADDMVEWNELFTRFERG